MKHLITSIMFFIPLINWGQNEVTTNLDELLVRCNIEFNLPKGLNEFKQDYFHKIPHDICFMDKKGNYEVRILFQPLDSMIVWYNGEMEKNPEAVILKPNDLARSMMGLAVLNASNNASMNYSVESKLSEIKYNADWVATSLVEVGYETVGFDYCYIIGIHKEDIGDVYIYYLMNKQKYYPEVSKIMSGVLKFN